MTLRGVGQDLVGPPLGRSLPRAAFDLGTLEADPKTGSGAGAGHGAPWCIEIIRYSACAKLIYGLHV